MQNEGLTMWPRTDFSVGLLSKKKRTQIDSSFEAAKNKLATHPGQGPFVLASKVPQATFDAWDDDTKAAWGIAYDTLSQSILLYGDTGKVHSGISGYIFQTLIKEVVKIFKEPAGTSAHGSTQQQQSTLRHEASDWLQPYGRTTMYTSWGAKSPDLSFYAGKLSSGQSVVIEIAHRNESFVALQQEMKWWHQAGIGLAIAIFVDTKSDITDPNLILLTFMRDSADMTQKRFGHMSGCNAAKLPEFMLQIPLEYLGEGASPDVLDRFVLIDLFQLQQKVISLLHPSHGA